MLPHSTSRDVGLLGAFILDGDKRSYIALYCCHYFFSCQREREMADFHSDAEERRMRHVAINLPFFLKNAAPRIDVYLSLHNVLASTSTEEFEEVLHKASISQPIFTSDADSLVRYLELRLRHRFLFLEEGRHDLAASLAEYLVKTRKEFPFLGKKDRYSRAKLTIAKWVVRWRQSRA
ncbi:hypothetical protein BDZ97DRAFT_1836477 [Flammula alnicola]|nr:hypothetical protein BDZ97DRAFT_1836477 [Flammula alnicola]